MADTPEQQIAALLRLLRPAPAAWVEAACEIPRLERELARAPLAEPMPPDTDPASRVRRGERGDGDE